MSFVLVAALLLVACGTSPDASELSSPDLTPRDLPFSDEQPIDEEPVSDGNVEADDTAAAPEPKGAVEADADDGSGSDDQSDEGISINPGNDDEAEPAPTEAPEGFTLNFGDDDDEADTVVAPGNLSGAACDDVLAIVEGRLTGVSTAVRTAFADHDQVLNDLDAALGGDTSAAADLFLDPTKVGRGLELDAAVFTSCGMPLVAATVGDAGDAPGIDGQCYEATPLDTSTVVAAGLAPDADVFSYTRVACG